MHLYHSERTYMKRFVIFYEGDEEVFVVKYLFAETKEQAQQTMIELGLVDEKYKLEECK